PIPAIPPVPTLAPRPLTLADAVTTALQNSFQTRQAALAVAIARAQLREAEAQKAVTLGGSASFTDNSQCCGGSPVSGTISIPSSGISNAPFTATGIGGSAATNTVFALTLKYPLYTGGALEAQIAIARANEVIAEAQFAAAAEQVVFSVRQAYYSVTASEANVGSAQRSVDAARENVRVAAARVQVGTSPQFDLLQAQVQLAQSAQALTQARTALSQSQQNLAATLVRPLPTTVVPAGFSGLPEVPQDVDALIGQALQRRPEIAAARRSEEHTSELQSPCNIVCRLLLEKKKRRLKANQTGKKFRVGIKSNISTNRNNLISGVDRCIHMNAMKKTTITSINRQTIKI